MHIFASVVIFLINITDYHVSDGQLYFFTYFYFLLLEILFKSVTEDIDLLTESRM